MLRFVLLLFFGVSLFWLPKALRNGEGSSGSCFAVAGGVFFGLVVCGFGSVCALELLEELPSLCCCALSCV